MGMTRARAYKLQSKLKLRLLDIFSSARSFCSTSEEISERTRKVLEENPKMPAYVRGYLQAIVDTKRDEIFQRDLVWLLSCDGELLTSKEVDALGEKEGSRNTYKSPWSRINSDLSRHCWMSYPDPRTGERTILRDKPYDAKFRFVKTADGLSVDVAVVQRMAERCAFPSVKGQAL
jgi:hypothetical protein